MTPASIAIAAFLHAASAQEAGIDGVTCGFPSFAAAVAAAPDGGEVFLKAGPGKVYQEGGVVLNKSLTIQVADNNCAPNALLTGHAWISGYNAAGNLGQLTVSAGDTVTLIQVDVMSHESTTGSGGNFNVYGRLNLEDSQVKFGEAAADGGGIAVWAGGVLHLHGSSAVITNTAGGRGGGIFLEEGATASFEHDALVAYNVAGDGGGFYVDDGASASITGAVSISWNQAIQAAGGAMGGGIFAIDPASFWVDCDGCSVSHNLAVGLDTLGGGLSFYQIDDGMDLTWVGGTFEGNEASHGGGISFGASDLTLEGVTFLDNVASGDGGGLAIATYVRPPDPPGATLTCVDCVFTGNDAGEDGGGMWVASDTVATLVGLEMSGNTAGANGGAIAVSDTASVAVTLSADLESPLITGNSASNGGGISAVDEASVALTFTRLSANSAAIDGGGLYLLGSASAELNETLVRNNDAENQGGGAALDDDGANRPSLTMIGRMNVEGECLDTSFAPGFNHYCAEFRGNTATIGGGLYLEAGDANVQRTAFLANDATSVGAAIALAGGASPALDLVNVLVAEHDAAGLAVIRAQDGTTLHGNHVTVAGNVGMPVRYDAASAGTWVRSIVWDNTGDFKTARAVTATCSSFDGVSGGGSVSSPYVGFDPNLTTTARGDYRLDPAGASVDVCNGSASFDLDSESRPVTIHTAATPYDRGCFEVQ